MKRIWLYLILLPLQQFLHAESKLPEDYYLEAFNEMSDMLAGRDSLCIKRAVYLAEWAYYEGKLDYKTDFCDEIDRISNFIISLYDVNKYSSYKNGKQMALNAYFFTPCSGNGYKPYTYDFETFAMKDKEPWDAQFVSRTLKTHKGQCRSLPWTYKILAKEIGADVSIAQAPRHSYIMYRDEDNVTPEEWINLEVTANQLVPAWWIKQDFEICDSAIYVGTYMTPLSDIETVACQMTDLAFGYWKKFKRYDDFTYYCAVRSLEFYPMNPNGWIFKNKSLEQKIRYYLMRNGGVIVEYIDHLISQLAETKERLDKTYITIETEEFRKHREQQAIEAEKRSREKRQLK